MRTKELAEYTRVGIYAHSIEYIRICEKDVKIISGMAASYDKPDIGNPVTKF